MDYHLILYYIGIAIVVATHAYMLAMMPEMRAHAALNLVAALFIAWYFMHKEGFIKF